LDARLKKFGGSQGMGEEGQKHRIDLGSLAVTSAETLQQAEIGERRQSLPFYRAKGLEADAGDHRPQGIRLFAPSVFDGRSIAHVLFVGTPCGILDGQSEEHTHAQG
jgi:hypothetical protein